MNRKILFAALTALALFALSGCGGSGSAGLNGAITLSAHVEGTTVVGTATYTNPQKADLIGTEIIISTDQPGFLGGPRTFNTNNSGSVSFVFGPVKDFDNTLTFTVTATTGNLHDFAPNLKMTGRTIAMTPPANQTFSNFSTAQNIILDKTPFVTVSDPIDGDISGHLIAISANVSGTGTLTLNGNPTTETATTDSNGIASLTNAVLAVPALAHGASFTTTIIWTALDGTSTLSTTGSTTLNFSRP